MSTSQNRLSISRALADHDQRSAATLLAEQYSDVLTSAPTVFPSNKDTAMVDATGGAINVPLPLGERAIIGVRYSTYKTDASANAAGLVCSGSDQFADGSTTLTTTLEGGKVTAVWDGASWRNAAPGSGVGGGSLTLGSSLTVGDGTGSTTIAQNKSGGGTSAYQLKVGSALRGDLQLDASENVLLQQRDGSGVVIGALSFDNATGAAAFSKALTIASGGLNITAGGATITDGGLTVSAGQTQLPLADYADDAAAAVGGVPVGGLYHTSGAVKIRQV